MRRTGRSAAAHRCISTEGRISPARPREPRDRYRVKASVSAADLELGSRAPVPQVGHALSARVLSRFGRLASHERFGDKAAGSVEPAGADVQELPGHETRVATRQLTKPTR